MPGRRSPKGPNMRILLNAFLLCNDGDALGTIEPVLKQFGIPICSAGIDPVAQIEREPRKFDVIVLDFDDPRAEDLVDFNIRDAQGTPSIIIALATNPSAFGRLLRRRVHVLLKKPVDASLLVQAIKAAYSMIVNEKRLLFRQPVFIHAMATVLDDNVRSSEQTAIIRDISQGGLRLRLGATLPKDATIFVDFELPEGGGEIHFIGKIIWSDELGNAGVQMRFVAPLEMRSLKSWLDTHCPWDVELEARIAAAQSLAVSPGEGTIQ
jgi:hypothetical protein